ncbi:MAG: type 1 glutamine amidotransferase [Proteobacteria bacterium]|nr:type 1 glutamine amidotransferase [Pseudomonadota bacterium]MBU1639647.1 type 1 glutamine amidotransferase [Pseudomonadota bacterium]
MKALIISGHNFEDSELLVPYYRFLEEGIEVQIASSQAGVMRGKHGYEVEAMALAAVDGKEYDLMILPGGKAPAVLRRDEVVLNLVRYFVTAGKTVAAICHGPLILVAAGVLAKKTATCHCAVAKELQRAGAHYLDQSVVVDGNLITARMPSDLPGFMREIIRRCQG